jgi:nucleoside-diphosphate kinase
MAKQTGPVEGLGLALGRVFRQPERTLTIIKPDAVKERLIGEVIRRFEERGITPVAMKMARLNKFQARLFYGHLQSKVPKSVFNSIVNYMAGKRVVLIVWQGRGVIEKVRRLCGPTNPKKARKHQIRHLSKDDMEEELRRGRAVKNIIHSSANRADALKEIYFFFMPWEIHQK